MSEDSPHWEQRHHLTTCLVMWSGDAQWKACYELGYFVAKHPTEISPPPERDYKTAESVWSEWFKCQRG